MLGIIDRRGETLPHFFIQEGELFVFPRLTIPALRVICDVPQKAQNDQINVAKDQFARENCKISPLNRFSK